MVEIEGKRGLESEDRDDDGGGGSVLAAAVLVLAIPGDTYLETGKEEKIPVKVGKNFCSGRQMSWKGVGHLTRMG